MPDDLFSVRDQMVLVSGGSRRIGRAIAESFKFGGDLGGGQSDHGLIDHFNKESPCFRVPCRLDPVGHDLIILLAGQSRICRGD